MEAKEKILHSNYKKFGIKKTWTKESKQAALNAMEAATLNAISEESTS